MRDYITDIFVKNATSLTEKREILSLTEAEQNKINNTMISKLFDSALKRAHVDYGDIPKTKGDITKYSGYANMVETLAVLKSITEQNKVKIPELDIVERAVGNIVANRNLFETGIKLNKDFVIMLYNTLVSSCVIATSALISSYLDYVKRIDTVEFAIINKKTDVGDLQITTLDTFNKSVASGEFAKAVNFVNKNDNKKVVDESISASAIFASAATVATKVAGVIFIPVAIVAGVIALVQIIRLGVFYFQESKMKLANYLEMQAMFLELNKNNINAQGYNVPANKKKEILAKQQKLIDKLRSISSKLTADLIVGEKRALEGIEKENSGWKFSDVKADTYGTDSAGYQLL